MEYTYQFQTMVAGETFPIRKTFISAWHDMYLYVKSALDKGTLSYQVLETAMWIEINYGDVKEPIMFYDARDRAIRDCGWSQPN